MRRSVRVSGARMVGVALMLSIPVLAVLGVFGERSGHAQVEVDQLVVEVVYPTRARSRVEPPLEIAVSNTSAEAADVEVELDRAYLHHFADVHITPAPITPYRVVLAALAPGETRRVQVDLRGDEPGRHRGQVTVRGPGGQVRTLAVETVVFP